MTKKPQFYVYLIRDPRPGKDNVPIYVGKGKDRRAYSHLKGSHNRYLRRIFVKCFELDLLPIVEVVEYFGREIDAFTKEIELIATYGRRDLQTGTLCNFTDGGDGTSGCLIARENMRKFNADPKNRAANVERLRQRNADPEFRKRANKQAAEVFRGLHADPNFQKAHATRNLTRLRDAFEANPIILQKWVKRMQRQNADPGFIKKRLIGLRKQHADYDCAQRMRAGLMAYNKTAEAKIEKTERLRKLMADPEWIKARAEKRRISMAARRQLTER